MRLIVVMNCSDCHNPIPPSSAKCCHCGRPSLFPNVTAALEEQADLQARYDAAMNRAAIDGTLANVQDLENHLSSSRAVVNRPLSDLIKLAENDNAFSVYPTYYHLSENIRLQKGEEFDSLRQAADSIFFTGYQKDIRFAALSLDSIGLANFGDCSWVLREDMTGFRASLFEENTTLFYLNSGSIKGTSDVPKGYRSIWADRAKLAVAKLAGKLKTTTTPSEYQKLLLDEGPTTKDDDCIEVHVFGPMSILTIEEVTFQPIPTTIPKRNQKFRAAEIEGVKEKLSKHSVKVS